MPVTAPAIHPAAPEDWESLPPAFDLISVAEARQKRCLPLRAAADQVLIVVPA